MDIQSSTLADFFGLFPVFVPGWVSPVKPPALANGGIPRSLYDDKPSGLQVVIDPLSELQRRGQIMAAYDSVAVFFNDDATSVASTTIQPGDEQKRISLDAKKGKLKHGLNRIYYKVTRLSGNVETSRDLLVLYHLRAPDNLALVIPADVVANGVSAARAAQGVVFGFTYTTLQSYDEVSFRIGNETFTREVTDPPSPLTITLSTADFQKIGDGNVKLEFVVTDQLGNSAISGVQTLNIHVSTVELQAPTVIGQSGNNFSPTQPQIRVVVPAGSLLPTDQLTVQWTGSTAAAEGSYTSPQRLVSAGLEFAVPRSVLAYNLNSPITVDYTVIRNGVSTTSPPLKLNILPLPASALIPPKIIDADANNVLDVNALGTKDATIHGLLWTLIEAGQQVWLWLEGKKADGSAHNLTVWNGGGSKVNATWVSQGFWPRTFANSYLKQLGHDTDLNLHFLVALDKSNIKNNAVGFPLRTYTIRSVALVAPTITSVKDLSGWEIPDNGYTVHKEVTVSGTAPAGQEVEVFVDSLAKGKAKAATNGAWSLPLSGLTQDVPLSIKAIGQYGANPSSNVRKFTVVYGQRPAITAAHDASGVAIANGGTTSDTSVTLSGTANAFLEVEIFDGTTSKGKVKADASGKWRFTLTGLTRASHGFTAKALYGSSTVSPVWTVIVGQEVAPTITSVKGTINPSEIPNGSTTPETFVVLTGTASPNGQVEIFDGGTSKGKPTANPSGNWTFTVSKLSAATHSFTAKALYGSNKVSPARTLTVRVELSENFDSQPKKIITQGQSIDIPSMRISIVSGGGETAIAPLSDGNYAGAVSPPISGRRSGQLLHMSYAHKGNFQRIRLDFKSAYSKVGFWHTWGVSNNNEAFYYNADGQLLGKLTLAISGTNVVFQEFSAEGIARIEINTLRASDWSAFDHFSMSI
ncbi:hypothetical protein [Pseudomonas koreensis]|uniref:hypothetical protein n=1 Tax=Pseudomonas koreensis TaxID=198620 RepID=UPI003F84C4C9